MDIRINQNEYRRLIHVQEQYEAVVNALHVADGGRYRNDTIESVLGASRELAQLREDIEGWRCAFVEYLIRIGFPIPAIDDSGNNLHWAAVAMGRIEVLEKDRARLDWMAKNCDPEPESMGQPLMYCASVEWEEHQTIRDGIDAAMEAQ